MVNCKGVGSAPKSPANQELCRYCRTQVCEECYVAATSRNSMLQSELVTQTHHDHACLACSRLHPEAKTSRSPIRERRRNRLPRLNSAPISGPRIDSMATDHCTGPTYSSKPTFGFLSASDQPQQQATLDGVRVSRHRSPKKSGRAQPQTPAELELSTVDLRRRRNTSVIAPTSHSCVLTRPSRGSTARELLRDLRVTKQISDAIDLRATRRTANKTVLSVTRRTSNTMELHTSKRAPRQAPTSYLCDFTGSTPRMAIRSATSTKPKELGFSMMDLRDVPKSRSCDLTTMNLSDVPNELELSTVDLRLPKYKVKVPAPTKRGRRSSAADPANSALTPIAIEHLAAIEAKSSSVELNLRRYTAPSNNQRQPQVPETLSVAEVRSPFKKTHAEPIDFHLSTVDLRPRARRHTTTDMSATESKNSRQTSMVEEVEVQEVDAFARFQRKKVAEPIDFHLSTFDLKPHRHTTDTKPESNQAHRPHGKREKQKKVVPTMSEVTTPLYSKQEPCDLAYLENFRSFTL